MSNPLDIAQAHLRSALGRALAREQLVADALRQAQWESAAAQEAMTQFLHNKYPEQDVDRE